MIFYIAILAMMVLGVIVFCLGMEKVSSVHPKDPIVEEGLTFILVGLLLLALGACIVDIVFKTTGG